MAKRALLRSLGDVDIRLVRVFVTVSECGGFAASELELNIGRSTISKHISDLETRMALKLCHRGPAGFSLTPEGDQVLEAARRLLRSIDGFQAEIDDIHQTLTGTLRLGLFDEGTTNPEAHLAEAIGAFDMVAGQVTLDIAIEPPNTVEARVIEGSMDVGIVPLHRQSSSLNYDIIYTERMSLYCAKGHPLFDAPQVDDFADYKYAGFGFNSPNMKAGQGLGLRRAARVQNEEGLKLLILSGRYLGFLAEHVAAPFLARGEIHIIAPERTTYESTFAAITRKHPEPDRKTAEFLRCIRRAHS